MAGYGLGVPVFLAAARRGWTVFGGIGMLLCGIGTLTFAWEVTNVCGVHYKADSWIVSFPGVMILLWIIWGVKAWRAKARALPVPETSPRS